MRKAAVLVAGSWGTALASVLADNGYTVSLWSRNQQQVDQINNIHRNTRISSMQNIELSPHIIATVSMEEAIEGATAVIVAATSASMREVSRTASAHIKNDMLLIHATKGFEAESLKRMTTVLAEEIPHYDRSRIVVLSGPSHAEEVITRCPTTIVVAADNMQAAESAQDLLINAYFRVYTNPDVTGVEVGGALKNIIALGAGMCDGLGFGDNAKAALITRGLAEIARIGKALGANSLTFTGLAGLGDLVVTCTSKHSRNWNAGYLLGQGQTLEQVLANMGMVVEGVKTTKAAYALSKKFEITMPITEALHNVLFEGLPPKSAVEQLMGRIRTHEIEEIVQSPQYNWLA